MSVRRPSTISSCSLEKMVELAVVPCLWAWQSPAVPNYVLMCHPQHALLLAAAVVLAGQWVSRSCSCLAVGSGWCMEGCSCTGRAFGTEILFLLRTALKDRPKGPPTGNHQPPPTANHQPPPTASGDQPPTANHCQPPPTTNHQPPTAANRHQPPPTASCQLPTANRHRPPTANRHQPWLNI